MKKVIAILLSVMMIVSTSVVAVNAEDIVDAFNVDKSDTNAGEIIDLYDSKVDDLHDLSDVNEDITQQRGAIPDAGANGTWGSLNWSLTKDGVLTISGTGAMDDFAKASSIDAWRSYKSDITSVVISSGVTSIGSYAFRQCSALKSVSIPGSVTSIGKQAFYECAALTSVNIPYGVTSIKESAFYKCSNLSSVTIPNSVTSIEKQAFYMCQKLTSVTIPGSVESIGAEAFSSCKSLSTLTIQPGVKTIAGSAFSYCAMTSVTIPGSVTSVASYAFNCENLKTITFQGASTELGASTVVPNDTFILAPKSSGAYNYCNSTSTLSRFKEIGTTYSIKLDANGGTLPSGASSTVTKTVGVPLSLTIPTYGERIFIGWSTTSPMSEKTLMDYDQIKYETSAETLYAIWTDKVLTDEELGDSYEGDNNKVEGYDDSKLGDQNGSSKTWIKQSAKWIDSSSGTAELRLDYSFASTVDYKDRDIIFVLDISDSMEGSRYRSMISAVVSMTYSILNKMSNNRVSYVAFGSELGRSQDFVSDTRQAISFLSDLGQTSGMTNYSVGLSKAYEYLNNRTDLSRRPMLVFFTDGEPNDGNQDENGIYGGTEATAIKALGCPISSVFLGTNSTKMRRYLGAISTNAGMVYNAANEDGLADALKSAFYSAATADGYSFKVSLDTQRFTTSATTANGGNCTLSDVTISNNVITWNVSSLAPAVEHYITIPLQLVSELTPNGKTGSNYNYPTSLEGTSITSLLRKNDAGSSDVINTVKSPVLMLSDSVISKITLDKQTGTGGSDYVYLKWDRVDRSTSGLGSIYYEDAECTTPYTNNTIVPPQKTGYTFMGYYTVTNGIGNENRVTSATGSDYNSGFKGVAATAGYGNESTVYASWTPTVYKIEYNLVGGTVTTKNPESYTFETPTFTLNNPTKTGYDFVGWTGSNGTTPQQTVTIEEGSTGNKTYTAQWKVHEYIIHFDGNGATSGKMEDQELEYDVPENLPKNEFEKTGYTFTGWKDEDGNTYTDEQLVEKLTSEDGATITLEAQWKVNEYTISFNGNGATSGQMEDQKFEYDLPENLPKNEFEKTGYTFVGWVDEDGNTYTDEQLVEKLTSEDGGTINLEAQWEVNEYNLTVIPNGGAWNGNTENQQFKMDFNATKEIADPTRNGYTFTGWSLVGAGASFDSTSKIFTMGYEDATLTATWSVNTYELTFDLNGGNINGSTDDITTDLEYQEQTHLTTPERDGYTFTGWDVTGTESSVDSDGVFTMGYEDATVTAQWTPNPHKITYHGVEGLYNDKYSYVVDTVYDELITVDENKFYNDNFVFVKWNTEKDGSGTDYSPLDTFKMPDEDIILYAQWVLDGYRITYHANGGISKDGLTELTVNYATGSFATIEDCMFTREGYKFIGWGEDENVSSIYDEKMHMNGDLYLDGENLELYAIWEKRDIGQIIEVSDNDTASDTTTDTSTETTSDTPTDTESDTESDEPIPEKPLYGDVNCNGVVNMEDVAALQKIMAKLSTHEDYGKMSRINSDCDHNDAINMIDVTEIQKFMAKLIPDLDP